MLFLLVSFVSGVLTVLAPCILPVLPIIIGGTVQDGHKRNPYVITGSLAVSIILFTLLLKFSTVFINIPPVVWSIVSGIIILFFGITSLFPATWTKISTLFGLQTRSDEMLTGAAQRQGRGSDILLGAALGPVFSSCSPTYFVILATVLPASFILGLIYLIAYATGLALVLLLIGLLGQRFTRNIRWAADPNGWFKKGLGILFILVGIFILTGANKKVQTGILESGFFNITNLEQKILNSLDEDSMPSGIELPMYHEIENPSGFVNADEFALADLVGQKVILLDFMTYSCINCIRTFPYLNEWYTKYADQGLEIVGIHTPEFAFEHNIENVRKAMQQYDIEFPVVLDNDYATWRAYGNKYWPRKYLIDLNGNIVYDHIGEGQYLETENEIRVLLGLTALDEDGAEELTRGIRVSPETYFGAARNERLINGKVGVVGTQTMEFPVFSPLDGLILDGTWDIQPEYALGLARANIVFKFTANDVFFVASAQDTQRMEVLLDDAPVPSNMAGSDIVMIDGRSYADISEERLYTLINNASDATHVLRLMGSDGVQAYTFTFGG